MMSAYARAKQSRSEPSPLHLDLGDRSLNQFIDQLSATAYRAYPEAPRSIEAYRAVREAVDTYMKGVVVAYDACGLSNLCHEAEPYDPWR